MSEKNINSRIQHKHDIEANWLKAINFIPKAGELIVYDVDENYSYPRIKIGNGSQNVNNLNFVDSSNFKMCSIIGKATMKAEEDVHIVNIENNYTPKPGDFLYITIMEGQVDGSHNLGDGQYIKINNLDPIPVRYVGTYGKQLGVEASFNDTTDVHALYQYTGSQYLLLHHFDGEVMQAFAANFMQTYMAQAMTNVELPSTLLDFYYTINNGFGQISETFENLAEYLLASQPNWDAGEDELGHILNRTHYDSMEYILPEQQLSFSSGDYSNQLQDYIPVEIGDTLAINFNGTEHICVVHDASAFVAEQGMPAEYIAGAVGAGFSGGDIIEQLGKNPFVIVFLNLLGYSEFGIGIYLEVFGEYRQSDISFSIKKKELKKLDSKFLPDEIPHTEKGSGKIILPATPITPADNGICLYKEPRIDLTLGKEYVVTWGSEKYYCSPVVVEFEGIPMIGLGNTLALNGEDTGEPFAIGVITNTSAVFTMMVGCYDIENVPSTFSISESKEVVYKLDGKFLPNGTPYAEFDTILPRTYATINMEIEGLTGYIHPSQVSIDIGQTYLVNWNGIEYECESSMVQPDSESTQGIVLGNISILSGDIPSTEEPFAILFLDQETFINTGMGMLVIPLDGSTEFSLSIDLKPKYHIIDSNLLPEGVPHTEYFNDIILPETIFKYDETLFPSPFQSIPNRIPIELGKKYIVNYEGVEYECIGEYCNIDGVIVNGIGLGDVDETKSFPFILMVDSKSSDDVTLLQAYDNPTVGKLISITHQKEIIHKLDSKYLPDSIGEESATDVDNKISSHNTSTSAHNDIRELISALPLTELITVADIDTICGTIISMASEVTF